MTRDVVVGVILGSVFDPKGSAWTLLMIYFADFVVLVAARPYRDVVVMFANFVNGGARVAMLALMVTFLYDGYDRPHSQMYFTFLALGSITVGRAKAAWLLVSTLCSTGARCT